MLGWDSSVMMPLGGAAARGDQLAVLAGLWHELLTDPAVGEWLEAASAPAQEPADEWEAANLRLMRRAQRARDGIAGRVGRGAVARQFHMRENLARGAAGFRLRQREAISGRGAEAGAGNGPAMGRKVWLHAL